MISKSRMLGHPNTLWMLVSFIGILLTLTAIFIYSTDKQQTLNKHLYTQALIWNAYNYEKHQLGRQAKDLAYWSEAIEELFIVPDATWADANIGSYLYQNFDIDLVLVAQAHQSSQWIHFYYQGENLIWNRLWSDTSIQARWQNALQASTELQNLSKHSLHPLYVSNKKYYVSLLEIDQVLYLAASFAFQPDLPLPVTDDVLQDANTHEFYKDKVLILAKKLDEHFLPLIKNSFLLQEAKIKRFPHQVQLKNLPMQTNQIFLGQIQNDAILIDFQPPADAHTWMNQISYIGISLVFVCLAFGSYLWTRVYKLNLNYQATNQALISENQRRRHTEQALNQFKASLEQQVKERTLALEEQKNYLSSIILNISEAIIITNQQGKILSSNAMGYRLFGTHQDNLLELNIQQLMTSSQHPISFDFIKNKLFELEKSQLYIIAAEDRHLPINLSLTELRTQRGLEYVLIIRDISLEFALQKAKEQAAKGLAYILENTDEAYLVLDKEGIIQEVNTAFCHLLHQEKKYLLGLKLAQALYPESRQVPPEINLWLETVQHKGHGHYQLQLTIGHTCIYCSVLATPIINEADEFAGSFAFIRDVSAQQRYAESLRIARDAAEQANRAKTEFLSSMSHELRTPMHAILGFAQLLKDSRREPLSPRQLKQVEHILNSGQHLLTLIDEILNLAQIEAGHLSLKPEVVHLSDIINQTIELTQVLQSRFQVTVDFTPMAETPLFYLDPVRLKQILLNLLSNAIKYNKVNGKVEIQVQMDTHNLILCVQDTGIGMTPVQIKQMFEPFQRLGQEHTQIEGTGIGLSITQRLVRAMQGQIQVQSEVHQGTCIQVYLPVTSILVKDLQA